MQLINHNSLLLFGLIVFAALAYVLLRKGVQRNRLLVLGAALLVMLAAWFAIRPQATPIKDAANIRARIGVGAPVLLELQSPYCIACTALRPTVDAIEREYANDIWVIRVNIQSPAGRQLAQEFGSFFTPTFIFFDGQGVEQWRSVGSIDREQIERFMTGYR
ncbi:MAG: thioredoxin family protein [Chloroflexota bacterium]